jgi:hypothetical protein
MVLIKPGIQPNENVVYGQIQNILKRTSRKKIKKKHFSNNFQRTGEWPPEAAY